MRSSFAVLALAIAAPSQVDLLEPANLHAWCIVPFDAAQRTPQQRAQMLVRLGLRRIAYDWRERHVAEFAEEFAQYRAHGIELVAFWGEHERAFALFAELGWRPQIWMTVAEPQGHDDATKVAAAAQSLRPLVERTRALGCPLALYNHGGWAGEPRHLAQIVATLRAQGGAEHVGIAYNFHHGHAHIDGFASHFAAMQPYLLALNLNGMVRGGDAAGRKILPLGSGDCERDLLQVVLSSGWRGPLGVIDHREDTDSESTLRENLAGLVALRRQLAVRLRAPLQPEHWPHRAHHINRDRLYDFYRQQATLWRGSGQMRLPAYPGLDGGKQGHWGNQDESTWSDGRWNDMDVGPRMAGVLRSGALEVAKAVCLRVADWTVCFDPELGLCRARWRGGFVKFASARRGLLDGLAPASDVVEVLETSPDARAKGRYRGYYRHGATTVFVYDVAGATELRAVSSEGGEPRVVVGESLRELTRGGPRQWSQVLETRGVVGKQVGDWPYVIDTLTLPFANPWRTLFYLAGHDQISDGSVAVCTATGDVWRVSGVDANLSRLRWQRVAAGLHQPLGLVVVDDSICVLGRDQITRLHDLDGDGEADFYECLSNDFATPTGGHDYLCGLERDALGRFYTASGRDGLLRIAPGKPAEVIATGFRNPDGLGLAADGTLTVPCSEGDWTPASAIAQITPGGFYGYRGPRADRPTLPPLCWLPRGIDNSAGGQTFVPTGRLGPLQGLMIHTSYGTGTHGAVLRQQVGEVWQGAYVPLPGDFASGVHRARVGHDGHLYLSGMHGWGTYTPDDGCLQRIRYIGGQAHLPIGCEARRDGVLLTFSDDVAAAAERTDLHFAQCWNYRYGPAYGSPELSPSTGQPGHDVLAITAARRVGDRQLFLTIAGLQPVHQLHLLVEPAPGKLRELFATVHALAAPFDPGAADSATPANAQVAPATPATPSVPTRVNPFRSGKPGRELRLATAAGLQFASRELLASPGEQLSLTLDNPDVLPHNWVLVAVGREAQVGALADLLIADHQALARHYVPETPDVLVWTDLVAPQASCTVHFTAPTVPGDYPYLCTFPGHWGVMRGVLRVRAGK